MSELRSIKARELLAALSREPLSYAIVRQRGPTEGSTHPVGRRSRSHSTTAPRSRPAFVGEILRRNVGVGEDEALKLL